MVPMSAEFIASGTITCSNMLVCLLTTIFIPQKSLNKACTKWLKTRDLQPWNSFFFFTLTLFLSSHIAKVFKTPNVPFYVLCPQFPPPPQLFFLPKRISSLLTIMNHKQLVLKICSQAFLISSSPLRSTVKPAVSNGCTLRVHSDSCNDSVSKRKLWRLL